MGNYTSFEKFLNEKINALTKEADNLKEDLKWKDGQNKVLIEQKDELLGIISKVFTVKKDGMSDYRHELWMTALDYGACASCHELNCFGDCME